jgi:hypothetical protein
MILFQRFKEDIFGHESNGPINTIFYINKIDRYYIMIHKVWWSISFYISITKQKKMINKSVR